MVTVNNPMIMVFMHSSSCKIVVLCVIVLFENIDALQKALHILLFIRCEVRCPVDQELDKSRFYYGTLNNI